MKGSVDTKQLTAFTAKLNKIAKTDLKKQYIQWLNKSGTEFLNVVRDEIIKKNSVDSKRLLSAFQKGAAESIWVLNEGGFTLEVGTNASYASYINSGYWEMRPDHVKDFIPGTWRGDLFTYLPDADTGLIIRRQWKEGNHYWESAIKIFEKMYPGVLEKEVEKWFASQF